MAMDHAISSLRSLLARMSNIFAFACSSPLSVVSQKSTTG